ncbi:MAG: YbhB/YbcL family Raf kinase inhibitor-like protein [Methanomassiliicoccus sp.]|nr:YbhB/YbcL family Raf kinase inhibitor-like protein [Methanomassiliicoccus sp.]
MKMIEEQVAHRPGERGLKVTVESGSLTDDEVCEGTKYSPQIGVGNLRAPFMAVTMEEMDRDRPGQVHWLLWNVERAETVPRNLPKQAEFDHPIRGRQGRNSYGDLGYSAPCPPQGAKRTYRFRVFGLSEELDLAGGTRGRDLEKAMEGRILQFGEALMVYERPLSGNILGRAP